MSKRQRDASLLEKINNIPEDQSCSDTDAGGSDQDDTLNDFESVVPSSSNESEEHDSAEEEVQGSGDEDCMRPDPSVAASPSSDDDNTDWKIFPPGGSVGRPPIYTMFKGESGPTGFAKRFIMLGLAYTALQLLIDESMIDHIKICTEEEARRVLKIPWTITHAEIWAFIGILYARGAYGARNLPVSYLWSSDWGPKFFRNAMTRKHFTEILRFIRFDKKKDRAQRLLNDKFAMISYMWKKFIENSKNCYRPGQHITIDEQLFPTKARCPFTQFIPTKPGKFGIKFWLAADVETKYLINGSPYLGAEERRPKNIPVGEHVVMDLMEPFLDQGRTLTTDNYFTSVSLAEKLMDRNTALVGTVRTHRVDLPKSIRTKKDKMPRFTSVLYKRRNVTLTVYKSKSKKKVILLSTRHKAVKIGNTEKKLPDTIDFYNNTKYGVDILDQMARKYSVKSGARRWTLQVFFNILDLAGVNAWVLYTQSTGVKISRRDFLLKLAQELTDAKDVGSSQSNEPCPSSSAPISQNRKLCQIGLCKNEADTHWAKRNKTQTICFGCKKYVCG